MVSSSCPPVSVVIPAFNAAGTLRHALESVLSQSFADFDLMVVDDGSEDETAAVALSTGDPRVAVHRHPRNRGAGATRNTGIRLARGELVAFLDADDVWTSDKLDTQISFMREHPNVGASVTSFWYVTEEGLSVEVLRKPASWLQEFSRGCAVSPGATLMVRRKCYEGVGMYDETIPRHEDFDWLLRFVDQYDLGVVERPLAVVYCSGHPPAEKVAAANEILIGRHRERFYRLGRFRGSRAIGKRWLETSIHCFMDGDRSRGGEYLLRALRANPFQRATMYLRIVDSALGLRLFPSVKRRVLGARGVPKGMAK